MVSFGSHAHTIEQAKKVLIKGPSLLIKMS